MPIIDVENLSKVFKIPDKGQGIRGAMRHLVRPRYRVKTAVKDLNLSVEQGEAIAYLGANGAGKSTTVKLLTGILTPSAGHVTVQGMVPSRDRKRLVRNLGVVFGNRTQLWWDVPVIESFKLIKALYGIPDAQYRHNVSMFTEMLDLEEILPSAVRRLSLGQRMRAELAAAMLPDPPLVFLDEPTVGLDVAIKEVVRNFIRKINSESGTTILLTSHDLTDIEDLCHRIVILEKGQKIYDGSIDAIKASFARDRQLIVRLRTHADQQVLDAVSIALPTVTFTQESSHQLRARFDRSVHNAAAIVGHIMDQFDVEDFELREPGIEDIVRGVFSGAIDLQANQ